LANLAAQLQHDLVQPLTDFAEDLAGAEVGYFTSVASAAAGNFASWAAGELTDEAEFLAAQAAAASTWVSSVVGNYAGNAASYAQAEENFSASQQDAEAAETQTTADADVAHSTGVDTLSVARVTGSVARRRTFEEGAVQRDNTRAETGTQADKTRSVAYAQDAKQYALDLASAERAYQLAEAQDPTDSTNEDTYDQAKAQAELEHVTRLADADRGWIFTQAGANKTLVEGHANAVASLESDLADFVKTFADGVTLKSAALQSAYAGATSAFASLVDTASSTLHTTLAGISAALLGDQYDADAAATTVIDSSLGSPWSGSLADIASTVSTWWQGAEADFLATAADEAGAQTTYQNTANTAADNRSSSEITAQTTAADDRAQAERDIRADVADAHAGYIDDLADPTQAYIATIALADRDYKVALATAERDKVFGEVDGVPYDQTDHDNAIASAKSQRDSAYTSAYVTYAAGQAAASGTRRTALNVAEDAYTGIVTTAQTALTAAMNAASTAYTTLVSGAETLLETTTSQENTGYVSDNMGSLATAVSNLAASAATPWINFAASVLGAQQNAAEDEAQAEEDRAVATATADETQAVAFSQHNETYQNSAAGAGSVYQQALTEALGDLRDAFSGVIDTLAAAAAHIPVPPTVPTPPSPDGAGPISALSTDEFFRTFSPGLDDTDWALGSPFAYDDESNGFEDGIGDYEGESLDGKVILDGIERQVEGLTEVETSALDVAADVLGQTPTDIGASIWQTAGNIGDAVQSAFTGLFDDSGAGDLSNFEEAPNIIVYNGYVVNLDDFELAPVPIEYMLAADGDVLDPSHPLAKTAAGILEDQREDEQVDYYSPDYVVPRETVERLIDKVKTNYLIAVHRYSPEPLTASEQKDLDLLEGLKTFLDDPTLARILQTTRFLTLAPPSLPSDPNSSMPVPTAEDFRAYVAKVYGFLIFYLKTNISLLREESKQLGDALTYIHEAESTWGFFYPLRPIPQFDIAGTRYWAGSGATHLI